MKTVLSILVACGLGFGMAYYISAKQNEVLKREHAQLEQELQSRVKGLESDLALERSKQPMVERVTKEVLVNARRTPKEILDRLMELRPSGAARVATIRKIIHELEDLSELSEQSVPAIRAFLAQNTDLDYGSERSSRSDGDDRSRWTGGRSAPPTEFTLPPSLRIGLFDVLKDIGSPAAEETLAETLASTGRAVEVAYLARILEEMAPGKYREIAIAAATDLLRNPLAMDHPNRLDEQAESYLYGVLDMYGDTSFLADAKMMLLGADGRLNRNAQQYLTKAQGEQVVSTFYDLYKNSAVSNNWDRMSLGNRILDYAGNNPQANQFLTEIVTSPDMDSRMKSFAVMRLVGGFGGMESPTDPNVIRARIGVVQNLKNQVSEDERLTQTLNSTEANLNKLLNGEPIENPWSRDRGDRGSDRRSGDSRN
ncbi:MAG: hypothetical protein H0X66_06750 [Verrucomicrobia bacterium]|nr:hypothetical protein [Verrucomicrobiota bacterium]